MRATGGSRIWSSRTRAWQVVGLAIVLGIAGAIVLSGRLPTARAAIPVPDPLPLKVIPIPEPPNLAEFVRDRQAAIVLGKALFWDTQVGSDGQTACASCHFQAGADGRGKNQINPGADGTFQVGGPNATLVAADFPFHQRQAPADRQASPVLRNSDDVAGSQGVRNSAFVDIGDGAVDVTTPLADPVFQVGGVATRRVTGRNAPSVINAVFNFANFWDGRANNIFNGVNPFGAADLSSKIFVDAADGLQGELLRIHNAGLASQAVGPPLSDVEMSGAGRGFPKLGKKMLRLRPLDQQFVSVNDSVLGALSRQGLGQRGLSNTYVEMIQAAFQPRYWANVGQIVTYQGGVPSILPRPGSALTTDQFTQMEANFSLFFGLAIQLYESTLVSDDTPFDRVYEGQRAFSPIEQRGYDIFFGAGGCFRCHAGSEFTNASFSGLAFGNGLPALVERMLMGDFQLANYDSGFYNIAVTPTGDDVGRGGSDPFGFPLSYARLGRMKEEGTLPAAFARYVPSLPANARFGSRVAVDGAFKVPGLRNVELTGPYLHNGSQATLGEVIEFYTRGGNFPTANRANMDPLLEINQLQGHAEEKAALIAFLLTLTDERVRDEQAPFDHPELLIPHGADADPAVDLILTLPAVGAAGRAAQGLGPVVPFMSTSNAPVVVDDVFSIPAASVNYLDVLGNDGDPDGDEFAVVSATPGAGGATSIGVDGLTVVYSPTVGFAGFDTFTYAVSDGVFTVTGRVTVTVLAANRAPEARFDLANVPVGSTVNAIEVLLNDVDQDGNPLAIVAVGQPANGTVAIDPVRDQVLHTPNAGFAGFDTITYTISDGALTSTNTVLVKVNSWPVAADDSFTVAANSANNALRVLNNDADADPDDVLEVIAITPPYKGTAVVDPTDTYIVYTPLACATGTDRISYAAGDGVLAAFATITVTIANTRPDLPYCADIPLVYKGAPGP